MGTSGQAAPNEGVVHVSPEDRDTLKLPWKPLLKTKLTEFAVKLRGRDYHGQGLIGADASKVAQGFSDLSHDEFAKYNFPQVWVERRQMPVAIDGKLPVRGAVVIDLGCGPGTSTDVLSYFADPSWRIVGYDLTQASIDQANERSRRGGFRNKRGQTITPRFVCQDIALPLGDPEGGLLGDGIAHMAISGGVVGLYMNEQTVGQLARELHRVLRPGGFAALDCGPAVGRFRLKGILEEAGFTFLHLAKSTLLEPRPKLVFRKSGN